MGLEKAKKNQEGLLTFFCLHTNYAKTSKRSHCITQLGPLNLLQECISLFPDAKEASQRYHIGLLYEKLTKSTSFRDHNLVHSIRIAVYNKKYPCMVYHTKLYITGPHHV